MRKTPYTPLRNYNAMLTAHQALRYAREWLQSARERDPGSFAHARALAAARCMIREARIHFDTQRETH